VRRLDDDLKRKVEQFQARERTSDLDAIYRSPDFDPKNLEPALALLEDVAKSEVDRETNLNARATAVAGVASVIVALSGAVAKNVFVETWDDWTKLMAVALFGVALLCLTLSICFTVLKVLRPTRGPRTKHFLGETVADMWRRGDVRGLLAANEHELRLLRFDRAIRTVPEWHVRNRQKARWLRRAWVFLALGVLAIAIASVFVVTHTLGIEHKKGDIAKDINEWHVLGFIAALGVLAALAVGFDWIRAGRGDPDDDGDTVAELVSGLDEFRDEVARPQPARG
jgi:hypothetical protein